MSSCLLPLSPSIFRAPVHSCLKLSFPFAGRVTFANMASYCITKNGVEALSDALRRAMRPWGVMVSMIEPGGFKTNLLNPDVRIKQSEALWSSLSSQMRNEYGEKAFRLRKLLISTPTRNSLYLRKYTNGRAGKLGFQSRILRFQLQRSDWFRPSILVISSYAVLPYVETDCTKYC